MEEVLIQISLLAFVVVFAFFLLEKRNRGQVESLEKREASFLLNLNEGVVVIDSQRKVVSINESARKLSPQLDVCSVGDDIVNSIELYKADGTHLPRSSNPVLLALRSKLNIPNARYWFKCADGVLTPVSLSVSYVPSDCDNATAVVLLRDVSYEEMVNRMKSDFIAIASHQLRSPMAALKWYGEMLRKDAAPLLSPKQKEYLSRMNDSTQQMVTLVDDFLDASRFEMDAFSSHIDRIELREMITNLVQTYEPFIQSNKILVKIINRSKHKVAFADPVILREVLANLVSNAVKYNRRRGKVTIMISDVDQDFQIEVKDTGIGIPAGQQQQIFSKFFRADNAVEKGYKGTGLGLYTAKMFLEKINGKIRFESALGVGTSFCVRFPRDQRKKYDNNNA
jgi:signal transduction histidine kinase